MVVVWLSSQSRCNGIQDALQLLLAVHVPLPVLLGEDQVAVHQHLKVPATRLSFRADCFQPC